MSTTPDPFAVIAALPGVAAAVAEAREAVDRLLGHRVLRRRSAEVTAESLLRGARASAALEGADWPLEEVRRRTDFGDEAEGSIIRGALRISAEVGPLVETWSRAPRQVIARLHTVAAADVLPVERVGRPRAPGDEVADPLAMGSPPPAVDVPPRLDALARLLVMRTTAPALVVSAVVHGELLALRPFGWGNGLVARAAERLVLVSRGLDPKSVTAPEVGYAEVGRSAYAEGMRGYLSETPDGLVAWVQLCARAVSLGTQESLAVCEALARAR